MNAKQIYKKLKNIQTDYIGIGRKSFPQDDIIIDTIMRLYYTTNWMDFEEAKWLFTNYIKTGILDFPEGKRKAYKRMEMK